MDIYETQHKIIETQYKIIETQVDICKTKHEPCIRLAREKLFELTNQDLAGGKNFTVLTSM